MPSCSRLVLAILAVATFLPAIAAAQASSCDELGEEWFGLWETTFELRECQSGIVFVSETTTDKICADDCIDILEEEPGCEVTIDGSSFTYRCEDSFPVGPGCNATSLIEITFEVDGASYTALGTQVLMYEGDCPPEAIDTCFDVELTGVRTGGSEACSVQAFLRNWGHVKGSFR